MPNNKAYGLKIYAGGSGLAVLKPKWNTLLKTVENKMYSHYPDWYSAYVDHLADLPDKVMFFAIYKNDELVAVIPLENTLHNFSGFKFWVLCLPLHYHFGLKDFVVSEQESSELIFSFFLNELKTLSDIQWDLVFLQGVLEESAAGKSISKKLSRLQFKSDFAFCDVLPVESYEEISAKFSKNFRGALRKARNKLDKSQQVEFKTSRSKDKVVELFDQFLDVESSGWKGVHGTKSAIRLNDKLKEFYLQNVIDYSVRNEAEISVLEVDGVAIAAQLAFVINDVVYLLKIGFDEKYSKLAPGNMLLEHKLKEYHQKGDVRLINLISDAQWHRSWKVDMLPAVNFYVCNRSLGGIKFALMYSLKTYLSEKIFALKKKARIMRGFNPVI
jgi:hypothetical protein